MRLRIRINGVMHEFDSYKEAWEALQDYMAEDKVVQIMAE